MDIQSRWTMSSRLVRFPSVWRIKDQFHQINRRETRFSSSSSQITKLSNEKGQSSIQLVQLHHSLSFSLILYWSIWLTSSQISLNRSVKEKIFFSSEIKSKLFDLLSDQSKWTNERTSGMWRLWSLSKSKTKGTERKRERLVQYWPEQTFTTNCQRTFGEKKEET